ncbi:MAG TPA: serine/threonine-protein kinase, partial [Polyangiaceae bacterium]|nr:serine/threonine-protein kinase [Polyangiaceae bacterium]
MNDAPVNEGDILAGKYRVERVLGVGGMGVVVAATHLQLEERVAIKFLVKEALGNADAVARFAREARAAVKIKSEHVARVIDVGTLETGAPYMVMEYLEGGDLSQVLQSRGPLPLEEAVEYVLQAAEAIAQAHVLGIVHRDLKPANLFLLRRPDNTNAVKVLDFGISKVMPGKGSSSDNAMTRTRTVMGSPLYMSPEQMASTRDVDGRTDIWALGAILYELVAGEPPFNADTMPQLCALILNGPTPSIRSVRPNAPSGLDAVLRRCLEKDPQKRFANIAEFANALGDFAPKRARTSIERISRVIDAASVSGAATFSGVAGGQAQTGESWAETNRSTAPKSSRKWVFAAVGATLLLVVGAVAATRRSPPEPQPAAESGLVQKATPAVVAPPPADPAPAPSPVVVASAPVSS